MGERGQGVAEYVLAIALIVLLAIACLIFVGGSGGGMILSTVGDSV